jgi:hypothetical protein
MKRDLYLYTIFDINRQPVLKFKSEYMDCFEVLWILQDNENYISCTRSKIKSVYIQESFI